MIELSSDVSGDVYHNGELIGRALRVDFRPLVVALEGFTVVFARTGKVAMEMRGSFAALAWELHWRWQREEFLRIGLTRPDGRPRRSGHRHRGTVGWRNKYRVKEKR